jgi:hypothetical protein
MKYYVISWLENDTVKTKIYKNRKAAEKFGLKMMYEHDTGVDVATYIDANHIETEHYN